jgi:hypothetical protein
VEGSLDLRKGLFSQLVDVPALCAVSLLLLPILFQQVRPHAAQQRFFHRLANRVWFFVRHHSNRIVRLFDSANIHLIGLELA